MKKRPAVLRMAGRFSGPDPVHGEFHKTLREKQDTGRAACGMIRKTTEKR